MLKLFCTIFAILVFHFCIVGQDVCVEITTDDILPSDESVALSAKIKVDAPNDSLKFTWKASDKAVENANMPVALIKTKVEDADKEITLTLEIDGLPPNCSRSYQKVIKVIRNLRVCELWDRPSNYITWNDHKVRLMSMANNLSEDEKVALLITITTQKPKSKRIKQLQQRINTFSTKSLRISKERIFILVQNSKDEEIEYRIIPKQAVTLYLQQTQ